MQTVYKGDVSRQIQDNRLEEYLKAGWQQSAEKKELVKEAAIPKPTIEAKAIVISTIGDANDKENEDGSING